MSNKEEKEIVMPKEPNDKRSVATKDQSGNRKLVTKNIFMRYNVGDKVRVVAERMGVPFGTEATVIHVDNETPGLYGLEGGGNWFKRREDEIELISAPLTEGQDEQNELWEEVESFYNDMNKPGTQFSERANLRKELRQSFTIKRK